MSAAASPLPTIGPATEARIETAFAEACIITAAAACSLIGCDPKTLREMTDAGIVRAVRLGVGKTRGYTEGDIRDFLTQCAAPAREKTPPKVSQSGMTKVVSFMDRRRAKRTGR